MPYFIIIILILIYILYITKEHFEIVGYNNSVLPIKEIPTIYENETTQVTTLFNNIFKNKDCDFDTSTYTMYSDYIEFPFNNIIKKMIGDYLSLNVFNSKIEVNSDINHLYWKDTGLDRLFIFNVNLLNKTHFMIRNIQVKILIKNIKDFINENYYRTDIPSSTLISSTDIVCIKLDTDNYLSNNNINGFDELNPEYYEIKNTLHLMAPFLTSI